MLVVSFYFVVFVRHTLKAGLWSKKMDLTPGFDPYYH